MILVTCACTVPVMDQKRQKESPPLSNCEDRAIYLALLAFTFVFISWLLVSENVVCGFDPGQALSYASR